MTVRLLTFNVHHSRTDRAIRTDILDFIRELKPSVLALQEGAGHKRALGDIAGYELFMPQNEPGQASTPILRNIGTTRHVRRGTVLATRAAKVPAASAGPVWQANKWVNWWRMTDLPSGRDFVVFNLHATPSIYLDANDRLHEEQMRDLRDAINRRRPTMPCFPMGDWNATPDHPNLAILRVGADIRLNNGSGGTKGPRWIDYIGSREGTGTLLEEVSTHRGSEDDDHMAVLGEFRLLRRLP